MGPFINWANIACFDNTRIIYLMLIVAFVQEINSTKSTNDARNWTFLAGTMKILNENWVRF